MKSPSRPLLRGLLAALAPGCLALGAALVLSPASADSDHDRARTALQAGQVLPLKTVLERLERTQPGQVLEVELEQEKGQWIYEIKLLRPGGQLVKLHLDARSADPLPWHAPAREHPRSRDAELKD